MKNDLPVKVDEKPDRKIAIGVSACLLGAKVRFDGGHKRSKFINEQLSEYFEFSPFCPETAIGMGIPRQAIRLVEKNSGIKAIGSRDPQSDYTDQLIRYGKQIALSTNHLCGFVFKKDSPSCGMERVRVYSEDSFPEKRGIGLFAREIMNQHPVMPVEEEGRLNDPVLRENFVNRVYVFARWKALRQSVLNKSDLIDFHTRHKYLLLAHSHQAFRELGRMLSSLNNKNIDQLADQYFQQLMKVLAKPVSRKKHMNVLQHLMGFLRSGLDRDDRFEILETIVAYGKGQLPLIVPITLLIHHFRKYPHPFVERQVYLNPHPRELMLRNSI